MNLRELVDDIDVPETRVAEDAWDRAYGRLVRRRALAVGAVGVAVATVLVGISAIPGGQRVVPPTPLTPSPTPSRGPAQEHLPVAITRPDWEALGTAPALAPDAGVPALSEDLVSHASLVMGDPENQAGAFVLGDDGRWRRLDVDGLVATSDGLYTSSIVRPTGLDPDGTHLAIPQPDRVVIVDLTTGVATPYEVPGPNHFVLWVDDTHVLTGPEGAESGTLLDTTSGATERSDLGPSSRVLTDGSVLTWPFGSSSFVWNGVSNNSLATINGGIVEAAPLVRGGLAVVTHAGGVEHDPPLPYPPPVMTRNVGIAAVDLASGDPVGFIPMSSTAKGTVSVLLGWRGDDPVLGLVNETVSSIRLFVAAWDISAGTLDPIATLPSWSVSWGTGF